MENFKFYAVTFLLIVGALFLGYGAIKSLRDPVYYVNDQTLATVGDLKSGTPADAPAAPADVAANTAAVPATNPTPAPATTPAVTTPTTPDTTATTPKPDTTATSKNAALIARLQKITTTLKVGSKGDGVKAVQEALNIVAKSGLPTNGTFGAQTETAVRKFQGTMKLPSTGQAGPKTVAALIAKLK